MIVIADIDARLKAWRIGDRIYVLRSPIIRPDGPVFAPLKEVLANATLEVSHTFADSTFMFAQATLSIYRERNA